MQYFSLMKDLLIQGFLAISLLSKSPSPLKQNAFMFTLHNYVRKLRDLFSCAQKVENATYYILISL